MTTRSITHRTLGIATSLALVTAGLASMSASANPREPDYSTQIQPSAQVVVFKLFSCDVTPTIGGNDWDNVLHGTAAADKIRGYHGSDTIIGKEGNDLICGDEGYDHGLYGQAGDDVIRGGPGNDSAVSGGEGNDRIYGDEGNDVLAAHPGQDHVYGGEGNDHLYGDTWGVEGPADRDVLDGGPGNNSCHPGPEDIIKNCQTIVWPPPL